MNAMRGGNQNFNFPATSFSNQPLSSQLNQQWGPNFDNRSSTLGTDMFFDTNSISMSGPGNGVGYDEAARTRLLAQASAVDLKRAQNPAYTSLHDEYIKLQGQLIGKDETITMLKGLLSNQPLAASKGPSPAMSREESSIHASINIPPSPAECELEDYDDVKYWSLDSWNDYKAQNPDHGKLNFLTDENGEKISKSWLKEMSGEARLLFNDLYRYRHDPVTWSARAALASAFFSNHMRQKFPEFRWCEGDWKVHAFATARYPNWVADARDKGRLQRERPSMNSNQQKSSKRKSSEDGNKGRKKKFKRMLQDENAVIDLVGEENVSVTSAPSSGNRAATPIDLSRAESGEPSELDRASSVSSVPSSTLVSTSASLSTPLGSTSATGTAQAVALNTMNGTIKAQDATATTVTTPTTNAAATTTPSVTTAVPAAPALTNTATVTAAPSESAAAPVTVTDVTTSAPTTTASGAPISAGTLPSDDGDEGLFAGLSIPQPPIETTPSSEGSGSTTTAAVPNAGGKLMKPSAALTPRNLFAIDYVKEHPNTTIDQFKEVWKQVEKENNETLKKYKMLSTQRRKDAKSQSTK